jgi:hypothetical protein
MDNEILEALILHTGEGMMTNARPTTIKIVKERDTDGYTVFLRHSNGTDQPLEEHLESVADAQARAR